MIDDHTGRRRLLEALGASALVASLGGCTGDDGGGQPEDDATDDSSSGGDDTDDGQSETDATDDGSTDETASGPGGDASFVGAIQTQERSHDVWDEFESLTVNIERMVFQPTDGDAVEIGVGTEVDLLSLEPDEAMTLVDDVGFPSGTYETAELYMPVQEATMADGSEPSKQFENFDPVPIDLELMDDYMEVEAGSTLDMTFSLILIETYDGDGWQFATGWTRQY